MTLLSCHNQRRSLPKGWTHSVKSAVLHAISLAQYATANGRGKAAHHTNLKVRSSAENDRLRQELSLAHEEIRIKDSRWASIPPQQRPRYAPAERLAILEYRAARGESLEQAARQFLVTAATISSWHQRADERGPDALAQLPQPVNKFPDVVGYLVQRLKIFCPTLGKRKIAAKLARAGLYLSATTVARMLDRPPCLAPLPPAPKHEAPTDRVVTAERPNHVWHVDLTAVPIGGGFWCSWLPFALPQRWPFCWWVAVAVDHFVIRRFKTGQ